MSQYQLSEDQILRLQKECRYQYSRSSGPGGQKVNKTETRVELMWSYNNSSLFNEEEKRRIYQNLSNRISKDFLLTFSSDRYRTRPQNQDHCLRKLISSIEKSLSVAKKRKKTKPTFSSIKKRIENKKQQGEKKKSRQKNWKKDF